MFESIRNRELGMMEIFSMAMHGFLENFKGIFSIIMFLFLPISILQVLIINKMLTSAQSLINITTMADGFPVETMMPVYMDTMTAFLGNQMLQTAVLIVLQPVGVIAVSKLIYSFLSEEEPKISAFEAIGEGLNCLGKVIRTGIPYIILNFIGILLFIIPGMYLGIIWTFYVYAIALRQEKGFGALKYSQSLVKNRFWKTVGFMILLGILLSGWNFVFEIVYLISTDSLIVDIVYTTFSYIGGAFSYAALTILFLNRESILLKKEIFPKKAELQEV